MEKNKSGNIFVRFFKTVGRGIANFFMFVFYCIIYVFAFPFTRCRIKGKQNLSDDDEARVFISNHYELYGPAMVFLNFPYKFRPWIIDKMMSEDDIEKQMGLMIYNNYKHVPRFLKTFVIKISKFFVVFLMKHAKGIPVSRENIRANIQTMETSVKTLEKKWAIIIWPEKLYVREGVGEFQTGFEHLAKYYYKKTGKRLSFYPMFISKKNRAMYIGKPVVYDPQKPDTEQKAEIINYLHDEMEKQYIEFEVNKKCKNKDKNK